MKPIVLERDGHSQTQIKCNRCFNEARAVWVDQYGAKPLCRECLDQSEQAYLRREQAQLGAQA
jgi:late competence protein required for DNA uptake (superfamily II DNA/RNA helicase)